MKSLLSFLLLATLVAGGQAIAQVDPDPDGIGIYADQAATVTAVTATPNTPLSAYLVLTRPSRGASWTFISGWECMIGVPSNAVMWGWNVAGSNWLNVGSPPSFQVGYGLPGLPASNAVLLMELIVIVTDSEPAYFYVRGASFNSGGYNLPVYVAGNGEINVLSPITPLHPYPSGPDQPSFKINPNPTAVQAASWGEVKALY